MARSGPLLTEAQWQKSRPCFPNRPAPQGWPTVDREPPRVGGDFVDPPERCPLAGFAGEISASFHLLAAAAGLGRAGRLAKHPACVSERIERAPAIAVERIVPGRQFRPGQKGSAGVGKTKRGKGTKWMVVVDGAGVPLGDHLHSASPAEVRLAEETLARSAWADAIKAGVRERSPCA
jgi:hypothetical protein